MLKVARTLKELSAWVLNLNILKNH
jgi:hypothetical protein